MAADQTEITTDGEQSGDAFMQPEAELSVLGAGGETLDLDDAGIQEN